MQKVVRSLEKILEGKQRLNKKDTGKNVAKDYAKRWETLAAGSMQKYNQNSGQKCSIKQGQLGCQKSINNCSRKYIRKVARIYETTYVSKAAMNQAGKHNKSNIELVKKVCKKQHKTRQKRVQEKD